MTRHWNEPATIENNGKELAKHLVKDHATNPIATFAAPFRMLREVHDEYHPAQTNRKGSRKGSGA